jgi:hypothetical protein
MDISQLRAEIADHAKAYQQGLGIQINADAAYFGSVDVA